MRRLVDEVLTRGWGDTPDGSRSFWQLQESGPSPVEFTEQDHARRLMRR